VPGDNGGHQLNILLFEVGYLIDDENLRALGRDARTVCVHCMEVVPETISVQHRSRSTVSQNMGGATLSKGGVGLRVTNMQGHFGVEARGLGGTGPARYERFVREVVRLSEAIDQEDVDEAKNVLLQTPGLGLALADFDPERCVFFVNFYNLWDSTAYHAYIPSFQPARGYRNAGATGNVTYSMTVQEVGPLIKGGIGSDLITPLFNVLTTWNSANEVLKGVRLASLLDAVTGPLAVVGGLLSDSIAALLNVVADVQALLGAGASTGSTPDVSSGGTWLEASTGIVRYGGELAAMLEAAGAADASAGDMNPSTATELDRLGADLVHLLNLAAVRQAIDAAELNLTVGRYYGIDDDVFRAMVVAGGPDYYPGPDVGASRLYTVGDNDTIERIETRTGVSWIQIQRLNNLSPREALIPGTELQIPVLRARGPQSTNGLPIFGSHQGEGAYGVDLHAELLGDATSGLADLLTVSGTDNLVQAITSLTVQPAQAIVKDLDAIPEAGRARYIQHQMVSAILSDRRFPSAVSEATPIDGGYAVVNTATTISDGTLSVAQEVNYGD